MKLKSPMKLKPFTIALWLCPAVALAQPEAVRAPLWGYLGLASPQETLADAHAFSGVSLSLVKAIDAVSSADRTGRVLEAGFVDLKNIRSYRVTVGTSEGLQFDSVDPATGAVTGHAKPDVTRAALDGQGERDLAAARAAPVTLQQAVIAAEHFAHGQAISGGVEQLVGVPQYYIEIVSGTSVRPVIVNPHTGRASAPTQ